MDDVKTGTPASVLRCASCIGAERKSSMPCCCEPPPSASPGASAQRCATRVAGAPEKSAPARPAPKQRRARRRVQERDVERLVSTATASAAVTTVTVADAVSFSKLYGTAGHAR